MRSPYADSIISSSGPGVSLPPVLPPRRKGTPLLSMFEERLAKLYVLGVVECEQLVQGVGMS